MARKFGLLIILAIVLSIMTGVAAAQEGRRADDPLARQIAQVVTDATGLTAQEIVAELWDGGTLAQLVAENGGNVDDVIAQAVTVVEGRVDEALANGNISEENAQRLLENLEGRITDLMNGERAFPNREPRGEAGIRERVGRQLLSKVIDATGLEPVQLAQALRDSESLADVITANGGDVDAIIADTVAIITESINEAVANGDLPQEQADNLLANLETVITDAVNGEVNVLPILRERLGNRVNDNARGLLNDVAEATGLEMLDIAASVRDGNTLGSILTENGVDIDAFVADALADYSARLAEQVEAGRISQAVADARLNLRRVELIDALNRTPGTNATDTQ